MQKKRPTLQTKYTKPSPPPLLPSQQTKNNKTKTQARLIAEVERCAALAQEKEALAARWDEQNALLVEAHARAAGELAEDYEGRLAEAALAGEALRQEREAAERDAAEVCVQARVLGTGRGAG